MAIREVDLPGVGKKFTLDCQSSNQVVVVLHQSGKREIYEFEAGQSTPRAVIELTSEEAQQLGGILSQTQFIADPSRELVMKELSIDWLALPPAHLLIGKTLREQAIRQRTGASIVAIIREGKSVINPDPDEVVRAGDTLMVIGNAVQVQKFKEVFQLSASGTV
jgi:TrkA domain protein